MELRFRKFLNNSKRAKQDENISKPELPATLNQPASPVWPIRLQSLSSNRGDNKVVSQQDDLLLCSVPYDTVAAGKAPIFSSQRVKGNGPVKLSCRQSAGEIFTTIQDSQRVLDDILEHEYIVGGKGKCDFPTRQSRASGKSPSPPPTPALSISQSYSESIASQRPSLRTPTSPWSPCLSEHPEIPLPPPAENIQCGLGLSSGSTGNLHAHPKRISSGLSDHNHGPRHNRISIATSPSIRNPDEQNATIAALWKAEYNRLVDLCGRENIDHKVPIIGNGGNAPDLPPTLSSMTDVRAFEVVLDPLPYPNLEKNNNVKRKSNTSATSLYNDGNSDASSHKRVSLVSSCARSSTYTTQTSATDHEIVVTRDDIRKIVDQMRSTYIRALETQSPAAPKPIRSQKKKKRRSKLGQSIVGHPVRLSAIPGGRQMWQTISGDGTVTLQTPSLAARATSQPADGFGRLSTVDASPRNENESGTNRPILQRADSGTLGSLMAKSQNEIENTSSTTDEESASRILSTNQHAAPTLLPPFPDTSLIMPSTPSEPLLKAGTAIVSVQQIAVKPAGNFF